MTWNVLWRFEPDRRRRERGILSVLAEVQPDVFGVQECWATEQESQAHRIARRFSMDAAFGAPSLPLASALAEHAEQEGVLMGVGLVSRWPIISTREHSLPVSHGQIAPIALEARIHDDEGVAFEVIVAATEWEPRFADDHLSQTTRLAELLGEGGAVPRSLMADTNCDET